MALVTFVDDNPPYLNAQNLNNNFNACYERAYIMVFLNATTTITTTAWTQSNIPFNATKKNYGGKFTLNTSTGVVSYSGNKQLKVSVHIGRDTPSTGYLYPASSFESGVQCRAGESQPYLQHVSFGTGSSISGKVSTNVNGDIVLMGNASNAYTYMIVEEM